MTQRMPMPALFVAAILAGLGYWLGSHLLPYDRVLLVAAKGAGVGLLALWAALTPTRAGRWIAAVLACCALGDVLLETSGLSIGAPAFFAGHLLAAALYLTERRARRDGGAVALALLVGIPALSFALTRQPGVLLYSLSLAAMVATAWISRFPRARVGAGAMLFAASDLVLFARIGPLAGPTGAGAGLLVWPLYLAGQAMIARGVVTAGTHGR